MPCEAWWWAFLGFAVLVAVCVPTYVRLTAEPPEPPEAPEPREPPEPRGRHARY